jgi:hypothetical protein
MPCSLSVLLEGLHLLSFSSGICIYYWITRYYCEFISHDRRLILIRDISGCHYIHYNRSSLRHFLLRLQVAYTACIFTSSSRYGHNKTSYQCIRCRFYCIISASRISSVRLTKTAHGLLIFRSRSQVVHIYCYSDVSLRPLRLI